MYLVGWFLQLAGLGCLQINLEVKSSAYLNIRKGTKNFPVGQMSELGGRGYGFGCDLLTLFLRFNCFFGVFH